MRQLIILTLALLPFLSFGQSLKKSEKQLKKQDRHEALITLLESKEFVVTANQIRGRRGTSVIVNPSTNFLAFADSVGVIQIAFPNGNIGLNGLGGETVDGRVTKMVIDDRGVGKGANVRITFFGYATFDLLLNISDSGYTNATLSGLQGQRFTYQGDITPLEGSDIFVGQTTF